MAPFALAVLLLLLRLALGAGAVAAAPRALQRNYRTTCDSAFCRVLQATLPRIDELKERLERSGPVDHLGEISDGICRKAVSSLCAAVPAPTGQEEVLKKKSSELERVLDAPLKVLFLKQLALLRRREISRFYDNIKTDPSSAIGDDVKSENEGKKAEDKGFEPSRVIEAIERFRVLAKDSARSDAEDWTYSAELQALKDDLLELASRAQRVMEAKLNGQRASEQAMLFLQQQQQQLEAMQQQLQGAGAAASPWNMGLSYRLPNSSLQLSGTYQQGRANLLINCVPDEAVSLLGPEGFVNGVTPGNVGVSININV